MGNITYWIVVVLRDKIIYDCILGVYLTELDAKNAILEAILEDKLEGHKYDYKLTAYWNN